MVDFADIRYADFGLSISRKDGIVLMDGGGIKNAQYVRANFRSLLTSLARAYSSGFFLHVRDIPPCLFPEDVQVQFHFSPRTKTLQFQKACSECQYIHACRGVEGGERSAIDLSSVKMIPNEVVFELTERCNQKCVFCKKGSLPKEAGYRKIIDQMDKAKSMGIGAVRFTGGEPLLYRRLPVLLKEAKRRKLYVLLNTNGMAFSANDEALFTKYVDNVLVSFQGFNTATETRLTGVRSDFSKKINNVLRIKSSVRVMRIGTIASEILLDHLQSYGRLIEGLNPAVWEIYRPMAQQASFRCSVPELNRIAAFLIHINNKKRVRGVIGNAFPFCVLKAGLVRKDILLGATADDGHSRIVYDAGGYFKPSYFIDINLGKSVRKSWENPIMEKIRSLDYLGRNCSACRFLRWCRGGSRFLAYQESGDYFQADPLLASIRPSEACAFA